MIQRTYQEKISQKILKKPGKKLNHVTANVLQDKDADWDRSKESSEANSSK